MPLLKLLWGMLKLTTQRKQWYPVPQDESGDCQVEILHLKPGEVASIEAKTNDIVGKQVGDDFQTEIGFKLYDRTRAYVLAAVVDFKGFVDIKGKPVKCNDKGKLAILKEYGWFSDFVEECRDTLAAEIEEEEKDADPN